MRFFLFLRRTVFLLVALQLNSYVGSALANSPDDFGCCVFWADVNRTNTRSSTEIRREQCFRDASDVGASSNMFDFFVDRACVQAERCKDAACTNLDGEAIIPPKLQP
jgi:hypothetical protein